jgi:hypothetical protein
MSFQTPAGSTKENEMEVLIIMACFAALTATVGLIRGTLLLIKRAGNTANDPIEFERYKHHNELVWVMKKNKGKHREHCLCFQCARFHPGSDGNCETAKLLYKHCVELDIVTPVWECPNFDRDVYAAERKWNR